MRARCDLNHHGRSCGICSLQAQAHARTCAREHRERFLAAPTAVAAAALLTCCCFGAFCRVREQPMICKQRGLFIVARLLALLPLPPSILRLLSFLSSLPPTTATATATSTATAACTAIIHALRTGERKQALIIPSESVAS